MKLNLKSALPAVAAIMIAGTAQAADKPEVTDELLAVGETAYARECAACHGADGNGKGLGAHYLNPRPRDFTLGVYKLRSTANGEVPTDDDLFATITNGIPNSMMPAFKSLSEKERWALIAVIRRFGGIEEEEATPISVPPQPKRTEATVTKGKAVYDRLQCATCHGVEGYGDGPSSLTLVNDAKERIFAPDITTGRYKGGSSPEDLYTRIATGLDGSPMPSYAAEAKPDEIWNLVHFLQSLTE